MLMISRPGEFTLTSLLPAGGKQQKSADFNLKVEKSPPNSEEFIPTSPQDPPQDSPLNDHLHQGIATDFFEPSHISSISSILMDYRVNGPFFASSRHHIYRVIQNLAAPLPGKLRKLGAKQMMVRPSISQTKKICRVLRNQTIFWIFN